MKSSFCSLRHSFLIMSGWPWTYFYIQASLDLAAILLSHPLKCWDCSQVLLCSVLQKHATFLMMEYNNQAVASSFPFSMPAKTVPSSYMGEQHTLEDGTLLLHQRTAHIERWYHPLTSENSTHWNTVPSSFMREGHTLEGSSKVRALPWLGEDLQKPGEYRDVGVGTYVVYCLCRMNVLCV